MLEVKLLNWSNVKELYENKNLHNLLSFNFYVSRLSRTALQEYARHRCMSTSCRSSRYTLTKDLKNEEEFSDLIKDRERASKYIRLTGDDRVDMSSMLALENLRCLVLEGISNDVLKYAMPECYLADFAMTVNFEGLRNFITLRTSPHALKEIRELAYKVFEALPDEVKPLLEDCVYKE